MNIKKTYPYILITLSLVGIIASSILMNDTVKLAENPNADLPCNINPFLSCTSVATKWQSRVFGFPNPILGIISFSLLFGVGLALLYHVIPYEKDAERRVSPTKRAFWILVNYGSLASILFVAWFIGESIYTIGSLCLYCMVVWVISWPIFLYTTIWNIEEKHFSLKKIHPDLDQFLQKNHAAFLVSWYLVVSLLIFIQFKDFFLY